VIGRDDHRAVRDVLAPDPAEAEVDVEERLKDGANEPIHQGVGSLLARAFMQQFVIHRTLAYPYRRRPLQLRELSPAIDRTRTLRGAVCGAVAAAVWAIEQPLDKLVFSSRHDDIEVLGKAVTRGEGWYPVGLALHLQNGAAFGAVYANIAPALPLPPAMRGPVVALVEHTVLWPLGLLCDRLHPARRELPRYGGNRRAFAQSAWRHLMFGLVLGELERRVNAVPEPAPPEPEADFSSNGHGTLEHAMTVSGTDES
jgi:hypothetical protein